MYGDENMEMVLLDENRSGLKIWAKLKKRIQKQQTIVFDKIFIQTPKKTLIKTDGKEVEISGSSRFNPDFEIEQNINSNGKIELKIFIGKSAFIKMEISRQRHLTVAFTEIESLTSKVSGIVGEFYRQKFTIETVNKNPGSETKVFPSSSETSTFTFGNFVEQVTRIQNGKRKNCWRLSPYQIRKIFGFKY